MICLSRALHTTDEYCYWRVFPVVPLARKLLLMVCVWFIFQSVLNAAVDCDLDVDNVLQSDQELTKKRR